MDRLVMLCKHGFRTGVRLLLALTAVLAAFFALGCSRKKLASEAAALYQHAVGLSVRWLSQGYTARPAINQSACLRIPGARGGICLAFWSVESERLGRKKPGHSDG